MQNTCCTSSQSYRIQVAHLYNHIEYMLHIFTIMQNTCCTSSQSYRIQVAHLYNHIEYMLHIFTIMQNACCTSSQSYRIHVARIIPNHIFFSFFYTCNKCTCTSWWTALSQTFPLVNFRNLSNEFFALILLDCLGTIILSYWFHWKGIEICIMSINNPRQIYRLDTFFYSVLSSLVP
jgi:hypothetical protein